MGGAIQAKVWAMKHESECKSCGWRGEPELVAECGGCGGQYLHTVCVDEDELSSRAEWLLSALRPDVRCRDCGEAEREKLYGVVNADNDYECLDCGAFWSIAHVGPVNAPTTGEAVRV